MQITEVLQKCSIDCYKTLQLTIAVGAFTSLELE